MFRASWSGSIRLSLVTVPVQGFTAIEFEKDRISLNQLHEECHSRIRYKKTCPIHGEVPNDEIIMGYEYGPDQYAIIDPAEINQLRSERDPRLTSTSSCFPLKSIRSISLAKPITYCLTVSKPKSRTRSYNKQCPTKK